MAANQDRSERDQDGLEVIPPGGTKRASDRDARPGGPPATPLDDRYAQGTPGGGEEIGGLAGTNSGDGSPEAGDLDALAGAGMPGIEDEDSGPPYSGISGGAVGGS